MTTPIVHNYSTYQNHGCRCGECKAASAEWQRKRRERFRALRRAVEADGGVYVAQGISHGENGYDNFSCRCEVCLTAHAAARQRHRKRKEVSDAL